ncbi:hypothetical protein diail_3451 [Diaporthe ilicicola]|nr:hypothetical protein diail_3451 [Diaporthe ilicicola]
MSSHRESQRGSVGSGKGSQGSQRGFDESQTSHSGPQKGLSDSQKGAQGPPTGKVEGQLYRHPQEPASTLSKQVLRLESDYEKSLDLSNLSLAPGGFPSRPGFGKKGRQVIIWANYFEMLVDKNLFLYQYKIEVQPKAVGGKLSRIIELLLQQPDVLARSDSLCTDFKSTLLSRNLLNDTDTAFNIEYQSEFETERQAGAKVYHLRLQHTKTLPVGRFIESLTSTSLPTTLDDKYAMLQAFNIFLNHYAKSRGELVTFGSKTFPMEAAGKDLGGGLVAIQGFFSSVRAATGRILVNVNVCYSAFYRPGPLINLMAACGVQDRYRLEQFLSGARVKTTHRNTPNVKTIIGLASLHDGRGSSQPRPKVSVFGAGPKQVQFWFADKQQHVTVSEFFLRCYNLRLNEDLPVVNVGSKASPVYLPPEVCVVLAGSKAGFKLEAEQMSNMIQCSTQKPTPARNALYIAQKGLSMAGMSRQTNPLLNHFHIAVNPNFTSVPARVLAKPVVRYGKRKPAKINSLAVWNLKEQVMSRPATIPANTWGWLHLNLIGFPSALRSVQLRSEAMAALQESLRGAGVNIGQPSEGSHSLQLNNIEDSRLEEILGLASQKLTLIYIILPERHTALYNRIKHICDVKLGIVNICSVEKKLINSSGRPQYFGNVGLKFNLKCGGDNQLVDPPRLHFIAQGKTMIVGIDVTHPDPGSSNRAPSIAAMVANLTRDLGQWPATSSIQKGRRQEMVDDLKDMLKRHLSLWKTAGKNSRFPEAILIFRDGVSEGQYEMIKELELPLLQKACEELYDPVGQNRPRITIVIVAKRHHTRFGPTTLDTADGNGNCLPGTVTDRGITDAHQWDFWLLAHSAIQGHARPAHYFVIHDEIFRAASRAPGYTIADTLEDITQSLHYTFERCTRAVSYCTPAYYADLVCDRARRYLSSLFDPSAHSDTASLMSDLDNLTDDQRRVRLQEMITPHPKVMDKMYYI